MRTFWFYVGDTVVVGKDGRRDVPSALGSSVSTWTIKMAITHKGILKSKRIIL